MELSRKLAQLNAKELRNLTATLIAQLSDREAKLAEREAQIIERDAELSARTAQLASRNEELKHKQLKIDQLTHEMATLKRWRYGRHSEQLDVVQRSLLDESIDEDIEAISLEIEALKEQPSTAPKQKPAAWRCRHRSHAGTSLTSPTIRNAAADVGWIASARM